jgi:adenosylhomocysteine nucleosidase
MDVDRVTAVCATRTEARAARRAGLRATVVGVGVREPVPDGQLVSFGLAGALRDDLELGDVLDAVRVVDPEGATLWEGDPLGVSGARRATMLAADGVVDDADERRRLHRSTGADAVDMESGALARTGRLAGCVRAVSDTPARPLGPLGNTIDAEGSLRLSGIAALTIRPRASWRALSGVRRALRRLEGVAA